MICYACGASSPPGMRYCGMCGAEHARPPSGRERRRVSIVFVDLAGFSRLTRGYDPEQVRDLADDILTVVAGVIEDFDGYVDAFRGDGLIALFGAPRSHPDDEHRAVRAAHAAVAAIEKVGRERGIPLQGRAGVNTGVVIAGSVGSGRVTDYTVMGSAVNLAARLEAAARTGEVWVGLETHEVTRAQFTYEAVAPVELPGFPAVREVYRLVEIPEQRNPDPYAEVPFVGREAELRRLSDAAEHVASQGRPRALWLVGEAGSGKTRLLREFVRRLDEAHDVLWLDAKASRTPDWQALAKQILDLRDVDDQNARIQRVSAALERILPGEPRWHRVVLTSLGLSSKKVWTRLERRRANRTNVVWRDVLGAWANRAGAARTVVLAIDNGPHTVPMMEFLELLKEANAPILIVAGTRRAPRLDPSEMIPVRTLSSEQSLRLIAHVTIPHIRLATESLVGQVGGNPAHLLELGRALTAAQEGTLSNSLASLLQARLDMIEPHARRLLADASLAGDHVWPGMLEMLTGSRGTREIPTLLDQELLVPTAESGIPGQPQFRFQSELLRSAAMRMVPFGERPDVHLRIASWLEQNAPTEYAEETAHQFRLAGSHEAAHLHYMSAVERARAAGDRRRVDRLFQALAELEVAPELLAQSALAHAETSIEWNDRAAATRLLAAALEHLEEVDADACAEPLRAHEQLRARLNGAQSSEAGGDRVEPAA